MPTQPLVLWLFGLSGAGKSTIGDATLAKLRSEGISAVRLDGDDLRAGLNADLGFSPEARTENLRRAAEVARLFAKHVQVVVCSFITPLVEDREHIKQILGDSCREVFIATSLEECERRDVKGLYRKARAGQIAQFTGVTAAFDEPLVPDLVISTEGSTVEDCAELLFKYIVKSR